MESKVFKWLFGLALALIALAAVLYFWQLRPALHRSRQVRSLADMNTLSTLLKEFREEHGEYPTALHEAVPEKYSPRILADGFGVPFHYESRGDGFILVSLGADRQPENIDYWQLRDSSSPLERVAGRFSADQVRSDRGWHREAGK